VYETRRAPSRTIISSCCPRRQACTGRRIPVGQGTPVRQLCRRVQRLRQLRCLLPEDGGPYVEKPRFFGSLETYRKYRGRTDSFIDGSGSACPTQQSGTGASACQPAFIIYGTIAGESYILTLTRPPTAPASRPPLRHRNPSERQPGPELETEARAAPPGVIDMLPISSSSCCRIGRRTAPRSLRQRRGISGGRP